MRQRREFSRPQASGRMFGGGGERSGCRAGWVGGRCRWRWLLRVPLVPGAVGGAPGRRVSGGRPVVLGAVLAAAAGVTCIPR